MAQPLQIKHGKKENIPNLSLAEIGYCTDTNELYVGGEKEDGSVENKALISSIPNDAIETICNID